MAAAERRMTRIGAVGFLNARPLYEGLDREARIALRQDVPAECARLLHAGEIDLGLVPVIELLRGPVTYDIVPGLAIGCDGPVNSVALFSRTPVAEIRRIAMDVSSRSSVGLVRVLCRHHFGIAPELIDAPPDLAAMLEEADAALLIGDPALRARWEALQARKIDLGEAWKAFTGLPFVFAVWAARPGALTPDVVDLLHAARRAGEAAIPALAAAEARGDGAEAVRLERYLRRNIRYDLDEEALRGLTRYLTLVMEDGLAARRPDVLRAVDALTGRPGGRPPRTAEAVSR
jgi:chorismate dehydratase